jgi:hypothetical protein
MKRINSLVQKLVSIAPNAAPLAISSVWSTRKVTSQMNRIDHILGNLASAAPKIALLVTIFAGFMIGGSPLVSAEPNPTGVAGQPTLRCEYVGRYPPPLSDYPVYSYFWFWEPQHVNTGVPCGPGSPKGNGN